MPCPIIRDPRLLRDLAVRRARILTHVTLSDEAPRQATRAPSLPPAEPQTRRIPSSHDRLVYDAARALRLRAVTLPTTGNPAAPHVSLRDEAMRLYADKQLPLKQIARQLRVTATTISRWARLAGVTRRAARVQQPRAARVQQPRAARVQQAPA